MDKVIVDLSNVFGPGMAYVALSRARRLYGMKCIGNQAGVDKYGANSEVMEFMRTTEWSQGECKNEDE